MGKPGVNEAGKLSGNDIWHIPMCAVADPTFLRWGCKVFFFLDSN